MFKTIKKNQNTHLLKSFWLLLQHTMPKNNCLFPVVSDSLLCVPGSFLQSFTVFPRLSIRFPCCLCGVFHIPHRRGKHCGGKGKRDHNQLNVARGKKMCSTKNFNFFKKVIAYQIYYPYLAVEDIASFCNKRAQVLKLPFVCGNFKISWGNYFISTIGVVIHRYTD